KEKEREKTQEQQNKTYSAVTKLTRETTKILEKVATSPPANQPIVLQLGNNLSVKIMTSIIHAHIMNIARPGTFAKAARDMFAADNLPDMEFPNDVPSSEIFNFIYKSESTEIQIPTTHEPSTHEPLAQEQTTSGIQPEPASEEESMEDSSKDETTTITEQAAR
ncbi:hypothetical protein Hamer_G031123, partial [Homarus americanus]